MSIYLFPWHYPCTGVRMEEKPEEKVELVLPKINFLHT